MISFSIVISTYNQLETLKLSMESLRRQIRNPKSFEIIIADDCSSDGTDEFVKRQRYPIFLKYSRSDSRQGRAVNRNRGFQKAAGQWIIFLDGDMVPQADFIDAYFNSWDEFPDSVVIGSWAYPSGWKISPWQKYLASRGRLVMSHGAKVPGKYFNSGNFAIMKTTIDKLCGFDTAFEGWGGEDTDFGLRLDRESVPIRYIPDAACVHYHRKKLPDILNEYEKYGQHGFPLLISKHPDHVISDKGWLLGLPGPKDTDARRLASMLLYPFRSAAALSLLRTLANIGDTAIFSDSLFDWLFYGHLAKGYRHRAR